MYGAIRARVAGKRSLEGTSLAGSSVARWRANPRRDPEPLAPVVRVRVHRQPRPLERQLGGDPLSARPLEELDEAFEQPAVLGHLESEPAADPQIIGEGFAKRGHATPPGDGHGRSARSALRSTFA